MGAAAIFARYALGGAGPLAVAAARLTIAALLLAAVALARRSPRDAMPPTGRTRMVLAAAGITLAIHFATWIASLEYTSVAVSTLLVSTTPMWTVAYDALVHRRAPSARTALAFLAGAVGLVLVVGFNRTPAPEPAAPWLGALLALTGATAFGAYLLLVRHVRNDLSTRTIVTHTYTVAAIVLVLAAAVSGQSPPPLTDGVAWTAIAAMALVSQLLGHTAINASLRWFSPSTVSFANLLEPVFAAVLAWAIFHETIAPAAIAGGALVLAAVGVAVRQEQRVG